MLGHGGVVRAAFIERTRFAGASVAIPSLRKRNTTIEVSGWRCSTVQQMRLAQMRSRRHATKRIIGTGA
jgi:hypothetical protein